LVRRNSFDRGFLARLYSLLLSRLLDGFLNGHIDHPVRRLAKIILIQIVVAQARDGMGRRFKMNVRYEEDGHLVAQLDGLDIRALLVEQEGRNINRNLHMHGAGVFLHRFLFKDAQDVQRS